MPTAENLGSLECLIPHEFDQSTTYCVWSALSFTRHFKMIFPFDSRGTFMEQLGLSFYCANVETETQWV